MEKLKFTNYSSTGSEKEEALDYAITFSTGSQLEQVKTLMDDGWFITTIWGNSDNPIADAKAGKIGLSKWHGSGMSATASKCVIDLDGTRREGLN